jgi:hypothetical protein
MIKVRYNTLGQLGMIFPVSLTDAIDLSGIGFIFVDRSGLLFEYVLDFLRSGSLQTPPGVSRSRMLEELDYYQIKIDLGTNTSSNRPRSAQTDAALGGKPDFERLLLAELRQLSATAIQRLKPATIAFMNKYMVFLTEHMRMAATQGLVAIDFALEESYSEALRTMAAKAIVSYGPHAHSLGPERAELFEERWILYELELIVPELYGIQAKMTKKNTISFSWATRMGVDVDPL